MQPCAYDFLMKRPPESIDGKRVRLRRATVDDAPALFLAAADPEVMHYMTWAAQSSDDETRAHLEAAMRRWDEGSEYQWIIEERASSLLAGTVSCRIQDDAADIGYFLARAHWGKGLAREAACLVVHFLKAQTDIVRIWATVDAENLRSQQVLEHIGLHYETTLFKATQRPNIGPAPRDTVVYAWCR